MLLESVLLTPSLIALAVLGLLLYAYVIHPALLSPLAGIPNAHWSAPFSPLWITWTRYKSKEIQTVHEKHRQLGPVIRLGPDDISVNCVQGGISTIYAGGFEKHAWYSNLFDNYGVPNMFSTCESRPHAARKRMLSNVYSKSFIQASQPMVGITTELIYRRLLVKLEQSCSKGTAVDIYQVLNAITMDFVTAYIFGLASGSNLTMDDDQRQWFLDLYNSRREYNFWPQELPMFTKMAEMLSIRFVPRWVDKANATIEAWALQMCDNAFAVLDKSSPVHADSTSHDFPVVFSQLSLAIGGAKPIDVGQSSPSPSLRLTIASEVLDHIGAGFDTSGITLTYAIHELSRRPALQHLLRSSLLALNPPIIPSSTPSLPSPRALDALPLLHAIVYETLRLHAAIPGPQPRITPKRLCTLGGGGVPAYRDLPPNVRVAAQAWSLHRNPAVFPAPDDWRPGRWLRWAAASGRAPDEAVDLDGVRAAELPGVAARADAEMGRWFWAFGSGGRMCIGSNLAMYQMKFILACVYSNFTTTIVDDGGIQQRDAYTAPPAGEKLVVRLERAPDL